MSEPLNSTIKTGTRTPTCLQLGGGSQNHQKEREICLCLTHSADKLSCAFYILQLNSVSVPIRTFLYGFFQKYGFLNFCTDFFKRDHFYRFYSLILLFCKLCECDAIYCEVCDEKYQKNLVSILSIVSILFSCFLM